METPKIQIIGSGYQRRYKITGEVEITDTEGNTTITNRAVLCGCGGSKNGFFCDGTHNKNN